MRLVLAILIGKLILFVTRTLKVGGGSAAPGLYALKIDPNLINKLVSQIPQNVVITGTNGKTTTARILAHLTERNNLKVIRNSTGSNLERGIASTLLLQSDLVGKIRDVDLGIWEVDEAAFNTLIFKIKPQIITFLNAFRDQLDRYGEVDTVVNKWQVSLNKMDWNPLVLVNGSDYTLTDLTAVEGKKFEVFGVKDHSIQGERTRDHSQKATPVDYQLEIGKSQGLKGSEYRYSYSGGEIEGLFNTPGIYNLYNLTAALSIYYNLNLPINKAAELLKDFQPAFGRFEKVKIEDQEGYIFLIKNPAGATQVFETVAAELKKDDKLLIVLNDNFADGKDVSWIWDAEFEKLIDTNLKLKIIVSGQRAEDLAVRLKYAGVEADSIEIINKIETALESAKRGLKGLLFILPTYTALLELQSILASKGYKEHYWKE